MQEMSDQEKSVLLVKAMGWFFGMHRDGLKVSPENNGIIQDGNLYDPANMALAWRVHLWALDNLGAVEDWKYVSWWENMAIFAEDDAQRLWLDTILELAIEAGLVEVKHAETS